MRQPGVFQRLASLGFAALAFACCAASSGTAPRGAIDVSAVHALLDVLESLTDRNPDAGQAAIRLRGLAGSARAALLDSLTARNATDPDLERKIDALLESPAYRLYYAQFRNVTPADHRRMLLALPFMAIPGPADIAAHLREIAANAAAVRAFADSVVAGIDLDRCRATAIQWLPPGEYALPPVHFILDGNGDAFARDGKVCFDLYSLVLQRRPLDGRYENLQAVPPLVLERILAHEFHHVFAAPYQARARGMGGDWRDVWRRGLVRSMASEGAAMHCDPPQDLRRAAMEDTAVVVYWVSELNRKLAGLRSGQLTEAQARGWRDSTYHVLAERQLERHLGRNLQGAELQRQVQLQITARPSLVYTLGWWMMSRISRSGADREAVHRLVENPLDLIERYDALLPASADHFRVIP